jgi:aspartyl-tRNA synthetase
MKSRIPIKSLHNHIGSEVTVLGFVDTRRDHGKLIFIDLRDESGVVQMVALPHNESAHKLADSVRPEFVVAVQGKVNKRPEKMVNVDLPNGDIELEITGIEILSQAETPPFDIAGEGRDIGEEHRLAHRYLDLRRPRMQKNIRNRHRALQYVRNFLTDEGFIEIETPILSKSTPEGARDFIVPARLDPGKFYALPQSPQQYKQLLMVAGFEKYFQIARCMRDEDTRGDRQAEFTQLDMEMAFVNQEDILALVERMFSQMVAELYPEKKVSAAPWPRLSYREAIDKHGSDRPDLRRDKNDSDELAFAWVLDFPLFEETKENGHFAPSHHMFTMPKEEDIAKLDADPASVRAYQHDLVLNGYEVGGGSIRIHRADIQRKIFDLIGFSEEQKKYFDHMLKAFSYGVPPHGGIAPGVDRLLMILEGEPNIREVIAFPKTGEGRDLMMGAPSTVAQEQLGELSIKINKK